MQHSLIVGVTQSGKTTLAQALAQEFARKGQNVIVYDPMGTPTQAGGWPESAIRFQDRQAFMDYMGRDDVMHAHVFIDEAYEIFESPATENKWLLTKGRHYGFQIYMIAQRPKLLPPTVRTQAGICYMFRLSKADAAELAQDFGHDLGNILVQKNDKGEPIGEINQLDKGDYLILYSGQADFHRANIFSQLSRSDK